MKCIFHIHTCFSNDCNTSLTEIHHACLINRVEIVIITDHNTIDGALRLRDIVDKKLKVVVGEEITTSDGEIIGLFLEKTVAAHKSAVHTIADIRKQGGLVCIPHPFDTFRRGTINNAALNKIIDCVDIIEVFNSRNVFRQDNKKAYEFATKNKKKNIVGSDAHTLIEINTTFMEIEHFLTKDDFLSNLRKARMFTNRSPLYVHFMTKMIKLRKKYFTKNYIFSL